MNNWKWIIENEKTEEKGKMRSRELPPWRRQTELWRKGWRTGANQFPQARFDLFRLFSSQLKVIQCN
jgi:hypothetical protein